MASDESNNSRPASQALEPGGYDSAYASNNSKATVAKKRKRDDGADMMGPPPASISVQLPEIVNPKSAYGIRPCPKEKEDNILLDFLVSDLLVQRLELEPRSRVVGGRGRVWGLKFISVC
jgi:hypothetical protein